MIKISVITISKNANEVIERTLWSVVNQTYPNLEYIVIDGDSKDGTQNTVARFDSLIDVYVSEPDTGIYNAMNKGVRHATGDWVLFVNAGDMLVASNVLAIWAQYLGGSNSDICFGRIIWNSEADLNISVSDHAYFNRQWYFLSDNFPHPATFYRKNSFDSIGWFDERFSIMADYELNLRAIIKCKFDFIYYPIITSIFYSGGISNSFISMDKVTQQNDTIRQMYFNKLYQYVYKKWNILFRFRLSSNFIHYLLR